MIKSRFTSYSVSLICLFCFSSLKGQDYKKLYQKCFQYSESNLDSALYFCELTERSLPPSVADSMISWIELRRGIAYSVSGDYEKSTEIYFELLNQNQKSQNFVLLNEIYNNLGIDFLYTENYDEAIKYYELSLTSAEQGDDKSGIANAMMNIGMAAGYMGDKARELRSYMDARELFLTIGDSSGWADATLNLGTINTEQGKYREALTNYGEALSYYDSKNITDAQVHILLNFAETYRDIGDYIKAIRFGERALQQARLYGYQQDELYANQILYKSYADMGNWSRAYDYLYQTQSLEKELFNIEKTEQIEGLRVRYESDQKEAAIQLLQTQNDLKELRLSRYRYGIIGVAALSLFIVSFVLLMRNRSQLQQQMLSSEVDSLKSEIKLLLGKEQIWSKDDLDPLNRSLAESLSERELEILELVLNGKSNAEISSETFISINTVKFHLRNIYSKLGVANRKEAKSFIQQQISEDYGKNSPHQ